MSEGRRWTQYQWLMVIWLILELPIAPAVTGVPLSVGFEIFMRLGDVVFVGAVLWFSGFWKATTAKDSLP